LAEAPARPALSPALLEEGRALRVVRFGFAQQGVLLDALGSVMGGAALMLALFSTAAN
jgi:hypothetical protein